MKANCQAARAALPGPAAIDTLAELFGLSDFERDLLLFVAGVEMDAELARLCAVAQGQPQRPHATFGVALAALENSHWSALAALAPLRRWRLLEVDDSARARDRQAAHRREGFALSCRRQLSRPALAAAAASSGNCAADGAAASADLPGRARSAARQLFSTSRRALIRRRR